ELDPTIGRDEGPRQSILVLSYKMFNVTQLIGPPGVGKTTILEGLASRIVNKEVPEIGYPPAQSFWFPYFHSQSLQDKRVLAIDLSGVLADSGTYTWSIRGRNSAVSFQISQLR
ncbi:hypothetical protein B0H14DRAFT_2408353, partial [Mycena olivaceomarginata]